MKPEQNSGVLFEEKSSSTLNTVTPLSKRLAMALFVALPFIGGYIGYTFAPEREITIYQNVLKDVEDSQSRSNDKSSEVVTATFETDSVSVDITRSFNATHTIPFDLNQYPTSSLSTKVELVTDHSGVPVTVTFDLPSNWVYLNDSAGFTPSRYSFSMHKPDVFISSDYAEEWPTEKCWGGCDGTPWVTSGIRLEYQFSELNNSSLETILNRRDCIDKNCQNFDLENGLVTIYSQDTTAKTITDGGRSYVNLGIFREVNGVLGHHEFHLNPSDEYGILKTLGLAEMINTSLRISE